MSDPITPERRAEILAAMKDRGLTTTMAAAEFHVAQSTIRKWIKRKVDNAHSSTTEIQRLRKENLLLKELVANFMLEKAVGEKNERVRQS